MTKTKEELKTAVEGMDDDQIALLAPKVEALTLKLEAPPPLETPWTEEQVLAEREADDKRARYESEPLLLNRVLLLFNNGGLWQLIKEPDNTELLEVLNPTHRLDMYYGMAKRIMQRRDTATERDLAKINAPDYDRMEDNVLAYIGAYSLERNSYGDHDDGKYANPEKLCRKVEEYLNALCQSITGWPCINIFEGLTYEKDWDTWPAFPGMEPLKKPVAEVAKPEVVAEPASKPSEAVLQSFSDDEIRNEAEARGLLSVEGTDALDLDPEEWMSVAESMLGWHEDRDTEKLEAFLREGGHNLSIAGEDGDAWCTAYGDTCLQKAGINTPKSAYSGDYKGWGRKLDKPRRGAVARMKGHFAFFVDDTGKDILGGNQSNKVCIQPAEYYPDVIEILWPVA